MKKYKRYISLLFLIVFCSIQIMPTGKALVWISPMKMLAEGNVTDRGICKVEKTIILENDGNKSAFVALNWTEVEVIFEENIFEIKPNERIVIHPTVIVREGRHTGAIILTVYNNNPTVHGVGTKVISNMAITVTALGHRVNSSIWSLGRNIISLIAVLGGVGILMSGIFIIRKKRSATVDMKFRCPNCYTIVTASGKPGDVIKIICPNCGETGKATISKRTKQVSSKYLSTKQMVH